jgi:hypothetical protein
MDWERLRRLIKTKAVAVSRRSEMGMAALMTIVFLGVVVFQSIGARVCCVFNGRGGWPSRERYGTWKERS